MLDSNHSHPIEIGTILQCTKEWLGIIPNIVTVGQKYIILEKCNCCGIYSESVNILHIMNDYGGYNCWDVQHILEHFNVL